MSAALTAHDGLFEMSQSEREVLALLVEHGGQLRQQEIVEATGWSEGKVSYVLADLTTSENVCRIGIGRENIVYLPGVSPDLTSIRREGDAR